MLGNVTDEEVDFHYIHSTGYYTDAVISPEAEAWFERLLLANKEKQIYDPKYLTGTIIKIKKRLVIHSFDQNMTFGDKLKIILRYISLFHGIGMILAHMIRVLKLNRNNGNAAKIIW